MFNLSKTIENCNIAYSRSAGIAIRRDAIRAEQGEYVIAALDQAIGTYNVHQCAVIYVRAPQGKHGLAHIDGHTEINSVRAFLDVFFKDSLQSQCEDPYTPLGCESYNILEVRVIGALSTEMVAGLNDPNFNLAKTEWLLNNASISYTKIQEKHPDFVIDKNGDIVPGMPAGNTYTCTALHGVQQLKRKDGYMGTYPIVRGCDGSNDAIYLDDRALLKLKEYDLNVLINKDTASSEVRLGLDIEACLNHILYYLSSQRNETLVKLNRCVRNQTASDHLTNFEDAQLVVPDTGDCIYNANLLSSLILKESWHDSSLIVNKEGSRGTVSNAIKIAIHYDQYLNKKCILDRIKEQKAVLPERLEHMRYDAEISVAYFNIALEQCISALYPWIVLTSVEENSFKPFEITNKKALAAASLLGNSAATLLHCIMKQHNLRVQNELNNLEAKDCAQAFNGAINKMSDRLIGLLPRKEYKKLQVYSYNCKSEKSEVATCVKNIRSTLEEGCESSHKCNAENLFSEIQDSSLETVVQRVSSRFQSEHTQFHKLRSTFLGGLAKIIKPELLKFDEYTISRILAYPEYQEPIISGSCNDINCDSAYSTIEECREICGVCVSLQVAENI